MSQLTEALLAAHDTACGVQGVTITYYRGANASPEIVVLPGKTDHTTFDKLGLATNVEIQDWIIRADRLEIDGQRITPQRGDSIKLEHEGVVTWFEVHHPDAGRAPFKRCDAVGVILRVYTQAIEAPAEE